MKKHESKIRIGKSILFLTIQIFITVAVFMVVAFLTLNNARRLKLLVTERTQAYAKDVTQQLASDITTEFESRKMSIDVIADSLEKALNHDDPEPLQEFLTRKASLSIFDKFIFISKDDISHDNNLFLDTTGYHIDLPHSHLLNDSTGIHNHTCISYDGSHNIFYTKQISKDYHTLGVLVGIRNKSSIQQLIQPKVFDGQSVSCIVDKNSNIIISPLEQNGTLQDMLEATNNDTKIAADLALLRESIYKCQNYIINVDTVRHGEIIVVYTPLDINDWGLLTFLPSSKLEGKANTYILRTIIIAVASICVFLVLTIMAYISYRKNKLLMEKIAFSDPLTGGLNNDGFRLRYHESVKKGKPNTYTVVLMNVKNFKLINEQFGTDEGDKTLRYIHNTIQGCLTKNEFVARSDADNFFVCLKESDKQIISERLEGIVSFINAFNNDNHDTPYHLVVQRGACIVDEPQQKSQIVQDHARAAYAVAIQNDTEECIFYDKSLTEKLLKEHELNSLFAESIKRHDFKLYLQPKIRLSDGTIGGAEALVRWQHPDKGIIFPSDFIPLFEKNGRICQLDMYMFEESCKLLAKWRDEGKELFPVSVNLSRQHYSRNPNFLEAFHDIAKKYQIPSNTLEFELTESIFFETSQLTAVKTSIERMHELGFLCSLDDFGAGFSSLGMLKEFDIDTIKFDRQFFLDISTKKSKDIIDSMIELSSKLGMHTVAEGIEEQEQVSYLAEAKCDMIQGYVFSKPLPVQDFEAYMNRPGNSKN